MPTTVLDLCTRAGKLIGAFAAGEQLPADDANDIFAALNSMLDSWSTERLFLYVITQDILTLTPSQQSYTVGPTGNLVTTARPLSVEDDTFIRVTGTDYPVMILSPAQYRAIPNKAAPPTNLPLSMFYDPTWPNGTLYFWPPPTAGTQLYLYSQQPLAAFTGLAQTFSYPPGYQRALEYSLAEEIAPLFDVTVQPQVARTAAVARRNLKRINFPDLRMSLPGAVLPQTGLGYSDFRVL